MTSESYGKQVQHYAAPNYAAPNPSYPIQTQAAMQAPWQQVSQPVYQCEHDMADKVKKLAERVKEVCIQHISRHVRVQTIHGEWFEGTIVNVDSRYVYLQVRNDMGPMRAWGNPFFPPFNPAANMIIPLVLYELLVISLLA